MYEDKLVFAQLIETSSTPDFLADRPSYERARTVLTFSCRHQFFSQTFAKLTYLDSLRYIEDCFRAQR
jgi:hypothetical protein